MRVTLLTKLALFTALSYVHAVTLKPIDVDDLLKGNYDLDTVAARWSEVKKALLNCNNTWPPYDLKEIRQSVARFGKIIQNFETNFVRENLVDTQFKGKGKFTDRVMQKPFGEDMKMIIMLLNNFVKIYRENLKNNHLALKLHCETVIGGVSKYIKQLEALQRANNIKFNIWEKWQIVAILVGCNVVSLLIIAVAIYIYVKRFR